MASSTMYFQPEINIPKQLEEDILNIKSSGPNNPSFKPDLEDNQKRWLIVGCALHKVITPKLRQFSEPFVESLYNKLKQKQIENQTFGKHIDGHRHVKFNYEAINNNKDVPKIGVRRDEKKYNFKVANHVDFSKLFLPTNMANYGAFDNSIDISALLGLIRDIDGVPPLVRTIADKLRTEVRNIWAHCNFDEWDSKQYQNSFQVMFQIIKNLNLSATNESELFDELTKWEKNGYKFLQGYVIELEAIREIMRYTGMLVEYSQRMKAGVETNFTNVHSTLVSIKAELDITYHDIEEIKQLQLQQQEAIQVLGEEADHTRTAFTEIGLTQDDHRQQLITTHSEINVIAGKVENISLQSETTMERVDVLESRVGQSDEKYESMKTSLKDLQNYMSHSRPAGKLFFYPPDRTKYFVAREKELTLLEQRFLEKRNIQYTQVICGLGGCGKTTLSVEFAWRYQESYPGGVFWMSAESSDTLEDSITRLAVDVNTTGKTLQETMKKTLKWISNLEDKWLLVIDNADESIFSKNVKELILGTWKRGSPGHVLITTRREQKEVENSMFISEEDCLCLDKLSPTEGVEFLMKRTGFETTTEDNDSMSSIVDELGGLPLALEQAAAHIKSVKCSFGEYLRRFNKKRLKILKEIPAMTHLSPERLTVKTTWQLNIDYISEQSENEGLGTAAKTIMEISSFLFADDIPTELINKGCPEVEDEDLIDALSDPTDIMCLKQIIEILTRFSLFQSFRGTTLSVHRLVQEVIRESMTSENKISVIKHATRMVHFALNSTTTPYYILFNETNYSGRGALLLWSKLAANANVLKEHLINITKDKKIINDLCCNLETLNIFQTTAIFHSLHQRQDKALADQGQMSVIIPALDLDRKEFKKLTAIKVPLLQQDRVKLQESIASVIQVENQEVINYEHQEPLSSELLRIKGNDAFRNGNYRHALQYYTEGIRACPENEIDHRILSNRSLVYIRTGQYENALDDANKCIDISSNYWKAFVWKAYAIAELIEQGILPPAWEGVGLAAASIASYMHEDCQLETRMKISYPVINYRFIEHLNLSREICSPTVRPCTTLMLRKGRYNLKNVVAFNSLQVIGIENGVEIDTGDMFQILRPSKDELEIDILLEPTINFHFENVFFVSEGGHIHVSKNSKVTFYKCQFSNGRKSCDAFPKCKGEEGCINPSSCRAANDAKRFSTMGSTVVGERGFPGVVVTDCGMAYLESCTLTRCGGGGVLASGEGSFIELKNCTVQNMRQLGIEARDGGAIKAENNYIIDNQFHGVAIGPRGFAYLSSNTILGNGQEGIWCGGILEKTENELHIKMNSQNGSKATIIDNIIGFNGLSGISFDGGCFEIKGNKIFENWLWGMHVKSKSSCYILNNDIFENKCGGIRIGVNYSSSVLIDGNTIRDHSGPDILSEYVPTISFFEENHIKLPEIFDIISDDEHIRYSRPAIVATTNVRRNNNRIVKNVKDLTELISVCCYCRQSVGSLKKCAKCKKATYCSKPCQTSHWKRHKHICKLLRESYTIEIKMANTKPSFDVKPGRQMIRKFDPKLKGIREGCPPDKTSLQKFIVKIQTGKEYDYYNPQKEIILYDQTVTIDIRFSNSALYHLANECGVLAGTNWTTKKIYCWASFKDKGKILCIFTDSLPPFQTW